MTGGPRVLHVVGGISWKYGGVTATILPMCEALARLGVRAEIAATDADGPGRRLARGDVPRCSVPIRLFRRDCSETWKVSGGLLAWLLRHAGDYDLIHIHSVWGFASNAAAFAARRARVPYVVFPQGMLSDYSWTRSPLRKGIYWRLFERRNLERAARLHLTARGEGEEMRRLRLSTPVSTIPLGLPEESWTAPPDPGRLRRLCGGRDRGRPIVLFLSRLHPKKGIVDLLLPAAAAHRGDAFFVIAGGADPHAPRHGEAVRREIEARGLGDRVALVGPVDAGDRWSAYDGAELFVLPSHQENFGLVVTEAMARGLPVVVSDRAYSCEHVAAAGAGRVVPLSAAAVAGALDDLLADPAGRRQMGRRGADYARRNLGWDRIAESVSGMYSDCIAQAARRNPGRRPAALRSPLPEG